MQDCFGLDVLYDFLQLAYCAAKEQSLARMQDELAARKQRAEDAMQQMVAGQEYESHRHKLMLLRDGQRAPQPSPAPQPLSQPAPTPQPTPTPAPQPQRSHSPPSSGLCSTPYPAPSNAKAASPPQTMTSPPRLAPPPGSGSLQMHTAPAALVTQPRAGGLGGGMDASIDESFFGDEDEPVAMPSSAAARVGGHQHHARDSHQGAAMGLLALDEPE